MTQTSQRLSLKFGNENVDCGKFENCFNTIYKSDKDAKIMHWLTPIEPAKRHDGVRTERFEGVGDWLLETSEFQEWRGGVGGADKAVLFCSGDPGVGKTYLSSVVIDRLCDQAREEDLAVAWLYCDHGARREQTVINMMGAILKRLAGSEIPEDIRRAFQEERRPLLPELMRILKIAIASLPQVFICIDALDECLPETLAELLKSLQDIVRASPGTRIFLTGRPHVREIIQNYFSEENQEAVVVPVSPKSGDIKNYLEWRLDRDTDREAMSDDLREDIVRIILERMSETFLLTSLNIELILGGTTIGQRRKKLEETAQGNGLSDAYKATLNRLKEQDTDKRALGLKALMWVLYSERPLGVEELRHALGVEIDSADLDPENAPAIRIIRSCCLGLLTVEESSSTVRLVHFTLQEHLSNDPELFHNPHSKIAEVCLTYLNSEPVKDLPPTLCEAPSTIPLLEYASYYWGDHARRGVTENVKILALTLLDRFDEHISAQLLLLHNDAYAHHDTYHSPRAGKPTEFTGLHGLAFFGIAEIVPPMLEMKELDINAVDRMGSTALIWASRRGNAEVIKVLLEQKDLNPNQEDIKDGATPLSIAVSEGNEGVVKMLLGREDVNPNQAHTWYGETPLLIAARDGHEGVVKVLLEREDIKPDHVDTANGVTPLLVAAQGGHEGVVKMLLEREDVNPDHLSTRYGVTPLLAAAQGGHGGVARMLLERGDVKPDHVDTKYGRTPLTWMAKNGNDGIVKILLDRENVNPDLADTKYGATPLLLAAREGHHGVVKILLGRVGVTPDLADTDGGRTPLAWAARGGYEEVVKMLLGREDVNPDRVDTKYGRTPLGWAAKHGNDGVVKILLDRGGINPDQADTKGGRTPLSWAAGGGYGRIVKMLLERKDVDPDQPDTKYSRTPLSWAAGGGHEEVVKILLEREDVNPNLEIGENVWMPLSWKVSNGCVEIVKVAKGKDDLKYPEWRDSEDPEWRDSEDLEWRDSEDSDWQDGEYFDCSDSENFGSSDSEYLDSGDGGDSDSGGSESVAISPPLALPEGHDGVAKILDDSDDGNSDEVGDGDSNSQPSLSPVDSDEQESVPDPNDSVPMSSNNGPLNNTHSTLSIVVNRYSVIGSCVFLLAFLAYRKNSRN